MERPCTHGSRCPFGAGDGVRLPSKPALGIGQSTVGLSVTSCRTDEEGRSVQGRKNLALVLDSAGAILRREGRRRRRTVREPAGFPSGHNPASPISTGMVSQGGSSWTCSLTTISTSARPLHTFPHKGSHCLDPVTLNLGLSLLSLSVWTWLSSQTCQFYSNYIRDSPLWSFQPQIRPPYFHVQPGPQRDLAGA